VNSARHDEERTDDDDEPDVLVELLVQQLGRVDAQYTRIGADTSSATSALLRL